MAMPSPDAKKGRERPSVTKSPRVRCALYRAESCHLQELRPGKPVQIGRGWLLLVCKIPGRGKCAWEIPTARTVG